MNSLDPITYYQTSEQHTLSPSPFHKNDSEVADSIVASRKSWKTVKGRAEAVWPPELEKALVTALLQYKPHDSRYAKALGRFPKRNRYISDFIFEQTGVRRSPKQVGSRLQQLKDVACGKKLLAHVSNWSLSHHSEERQNSSASSSELDPSITRHVPGSTSSRRSDTAPTIRTFANVRRIDVHVPIQAQTLLSSNSSSPDVTDHDSVRPFVRFGGTLPVPASLFVLQASLVSNAGSTNRPFVFFTSKEPIAARSISQLWFIPTPTYHHMNPVPSYISRTQKACLKEISSPLVATHTPPIGSVSNVKAGNTQLFAFGNTIRPSALPADEHQIFHRQQAEPVVGSEWLDLDRMPSEHEEDGNFVYAARLLDDETWVQILSSRDTLCRYTITQELICEMDVDANGSGPKRGEIFLSVTYRFAPNGVNNVAPLSASFASSSIPASLRAEIGFSGHSFGPRPSPSPPSPLTPASGGTVSPISPSGSPSHSISTVVDQNTSAHVAMGVSSSILMSVAGTSSSPAYGPMGRINTTPQDTSDVFLDAVYDTNGSATGEDCAMFHMHMPQSSYIAMPGMSGNVSLNSFDFATSSFSSSA